MPLPALAARLVELVVGQLITNPLMPNPTDASPRAGIRLQGELR